MQNAFTSMYDVSLASAVNIIRTIGKHNTVLMQGHIGSGKSSSLKTLGKMFPTHMLCYFDCTTKDLGDITIPQLQTIDEQGFVRYVTNEELGLHLGKPIILMIDEYGKANPAVKNAMLRLMLERKMGAYTMHKDSIVFATTNLGAEGVGDLLPPHARNRMTLLRVRKATVEEWIEDFALEAGIAPELLAWATETPHVFASFEDVEDPKANEYIYHPKAVGRTSFVTHRTMELASNILKDRAVLSELEVSAALVGTIGTRAAADLAAYIRIADQLPKQDEIKNDPLNAKVPTSASAICMIVHRTMQTIERNWTDAWMDYMVRLPAEAQAMFANAVRRAAEKGKDGKASNKRLIEVNSNRKYMEFMLKNSHLYTADRV